jgi:hypothetical protein
MPSSYLVSDQKSPFSMGPTIHADDQLCRHNWLIVIRLQLELLAYWFTIAVRPGKMLEDANYFSRLGKDVHIDPLLKDYLLPYARKGVTIDCVIKL